MEKTLTASYLFAPEQYISGNYVCFYCGLSCDDTYKTKQYVKDTFTNRDIVKYPGSEYVCGCCVASMATFAETVLIDGEVKKDGRSGAPRAYSWILTKHGNTAFSKKHMDYLRSVFNSPPTPPFAIVLSDSGKKQLIFRAPVNYDVSNFIVQFEDDQVLVDIHEWKRILPIATKLSAAVGKKALLDPCNFNTCLSCINYFGDEQPLEQWLAVYNTPVAKLAAWVCKGKDDARIEYSVKNGISEKIVERVRSERTSAKQNTGRGGKTTSNQLLLNFA